MANRRRRFACTLVGAAVAGAIWPAMAGERAFPFDRDLMLDVAPVRGSKRVPILEIDEKGAVSIDLWCRSLRGQANVGADSITIVPGPAAAAAAPAPCAPERQSSDENLLAALAQVTNWRRRGDVIELIGATTLRFRLMTN